jgi:hypothetical protein
LEILPWSLEILPENLEILPPGLEILPPGLDFLPGARRPARPAGEGERENYSAGARNLYKRPVRDALSARMTIATDLDDIPARPPFKNWPASACRKIKE